MAAYIWHQNVRKQKHIVHLYFCIFSCLVYSSLLIVATFASLFSHPGIHPSMYLCIYPVLQTVSISWVQQVVGHKKRMDSCTGREANSITPSGLHTASARGCHISTINTVALCPTRNSVSMGPLTDLSSRGLPWSTGAQCPSDFTAHNTWHVCKSTCIRQNKGHFCRVNIGN